jgi:hypothetical protein
MNTWLFIHFVWRAYYVSNTFVTVSFDLKFLRKSIWWKWRAGFHADIWQAKRTNGWVCIMRLLFAVRFANAPKNGNWYYKQIYFPQQMPVCSVRCTNKIPTSHILSTPVTSTHLHTRYEQNEVSRIYLFTYLFTYLFIPFGLFNGCLYRSIYL